MSGLTADARTMIDKARAEAQSYWFTYNEPMPVESVTQVGFLGSSPERPVGKLRFAGSSSLCSLIVP